MKFKKNFQRAAFLALYFAVVPGGAAADMHPADAQAFQSVTVKYKGKDYALSYKTYPEPLALDLTRASGRRDTPFHALLTYYSVFAGADRFDAVAPFLRRHDGRPAPRPADEKQHMAAARTVLNGEGAILISGEILFEGDHFFIYRYARSIKRLSGLPLRQVDGRYVVIVDLVLHKELVARMSALRWDMERIKSQYGNEVGNGGG